MSRRLELEQLLDSLTPSPGERRALAEMRVQARAPRDVLSACTYDPGHFTVSAFVTDAAVSRVVLIRHRRVGAWLQPGGHVEPGDPTLVAAVRREIAEETGLTDLRQMPGLFDVDVHQVPAHGGQPAHRHFDLRFHLVAVGEELATPPEGDPVTWVSLEDVPAYTNDRSVRRSLRKLLEAGSAGGQRL